MSDNPLIRLGCIEYLNTFPYFHGLQERLREQNVNFICGVPTDMNRLMREGQIDLALISSLEYALAPGRYYILNDCCIASCGAMESVTLFSKYPWEDLNGRIVALSKESLSSASLLKIMLKVRWGYDNVFREDRRDVEEMLKDADAALVIGDQALHQRRNSAPFRFDMSDEWYRWQQLPFCFALWAVNRSFADAEPKTVHRMALALEEQASRNLENLEVLLDASYKLPSAEGKSHAELLAYFRSLNYRLDPQTLQGLARFYELARQVRIIDQDIILEYPEWTTAASAPPSGRGEEAAVPARGGMPRAGGGTEEWGRPLTAEVR